MSLALVIGALAWTYSLFPDQVAVDFTESGLAERYVSKEHIFYIVMGIFLINNVGLAGLARALPKVNPIHLPIFKKKVWAQYPEQLGEHLVNWLYCLVAVINTITGFSLFALATINSSQYKLDVFDFSWVFYLGVALLIGVFLLPFGLLWTPVPDDKLE